MTKTMTKTLEILGCALVLFGAAVTPALGESTPAQTVASAGTTASAKTVASTGTSGSATTSTTSTTPSVVTSANGLSVARLVVATDVSQREPVGAASSFSRRATSRLYAFLEVSNPKAEATTLDVAWLDLDNGKEQRSYGLEIQAHKRWRTWARSVLPKKPGAWAVLVRDQSGVELARSEYTITE